MKIKIVLNFVMPIFFIIRLVVAIAGTHEKTLLNTADQKKNLKRRSRKTKREVQLYRYILLKYTPFCFIAF